MTDISSNASASRRDSSTAKCTVTRAPEGAMGQIYLSAGEHMAMRLWQNEEPTDDKPYRARSYETVGYVISGRAELRFETEDTVELGPGDSYVVPKGMPHTYKVIERLTALEVTSPPAREEGDDKVESD